jgi:hypothetical protein
MIRVALIGLALAAALPATGCMETTAVLREGRIAQTTEQVQQPQADAFRWMRWTPLAELQALFRSAMPQPSPANMSNATVLRFDQTPAVQAERPVQRSTARLKSLPRPTVLVAQRGPSPDPPMPPRRLGSGPPTMVPERSPRLPQARAVGPILPLADPAPRASSVGLLARPAAVAEPRRQQLDPPAEEPTEIGSNLASAKSGWVSIEAQKTPSTSTLHQLQPESSVLYLAVRGEIRTVADLNGKPIALGAQEPAVERAIKQAFAAAGVTPSFVGDAQTDALRQLVAREVVAAPLLVGQPIELTDIADTLSRLDLRLLELPLDLPQPQ